MKFTPLADRLIIEVDETVTENSFGMKIPHSAQEKPLRAIVLAKGPAVSDNIQVGDAVIYSQGTTTTFTDQKTEESVTYIREANIHLIIKQQ